MTKENHGSTALVVGEADADNCAQLGEALLDDLIVGRLAVDLAGLTFLDSSATSELLRVYKVLSERDVEMTIISPSPAVYRVLEITGLLEHFGIAPA